MRLPEIWSRETWARAAAPTIPAVDVISGRMVSPGTAHHAEYVGQDCWVVDWLPGRQLSAEQARSAMRIAVAPGYAEVERWAAGLGLTANEARVYVAGVA